MDSAHHRKDWRYCGAFIVQFTGVLSIDSMFMVQCTCIVQLRFNLDLLIDFTLLRLTLYCISWIS